MKTSLRITNAAAILGMAVLFSAPTMAQTTGSTSGSSATTRADVREVSEDRDWGWLGLIGLLGLAGLKRREPHTDLGQARPASR